MAGASRAGLVAGGLGPPPEEDEARGFTVSLPLSHKESDNDRGFHLSSLAS
jgi:hypothetical protein